MPLRASEIFLEPNVMRGGVFPWPKLTDDAIELVAS